MWGNYSFSIWENVNWYVLNFLVFLSLSILQILPQSPADGLPIETIVPYSRGFVCGGGGGMLHLFEKTEDKEYYRKVKSVKIEPPSAAQGPSGLLLSFFFLYTYIRTVGVKVKSVTINSNEENLACTLENNQIYVFSLSINDIVREQNLEYLSNLCHGYKFSSPSSFSSTNFRISASVTGMDTCIRKNLLVTCSTDRTVRIWNFKTHTNELTKYFPEEAYSIAFHPSGYRIYFGN